METAIYTEKYKGCNISIYPDNDCESPDNWGDDSIFLCGFHRDFYVTPHDIKSSEDIDKYKDTHHIFALTAYIHSGVALSLSSDGYPFNDRWDSCQVGVVFVSKKETRLRKSAEKLASGLVKTWNDNLSGNVYGYKVEESDDSCWGFYGDYNTSGILQEARDSIDYYVEKKRKSAIEKLKVYIKNHVPFEKRELVRI